MRATRIQSLFLFFMASLLALALALPAQAAPSAERRVALVIGNGAYKAGPLKNPANDARDMAAALRGAGFEVILRENAGLRQMNEAIDQFWNSLKRGGVGLFFFAGHGVQVAGENYLVPVDARIAMEKDVQYECVNAGKVLGRMEDAGNGLNIVILDACRNNPFARSFRSADRGLAKMDAPTGSLIAFATAPGDVAADGEGKNGLYTSHLLRHLNTPGLTIENVLKRTRIGVAADSSRLGRKQTPWESSSLMGDFFFVGGGQGAGQVASLGPVAVPQAPAKQAPAQPVASGAPHVELQGLGRAILKGSGGPALVYVSDPFCVYCRKAFADLQGRAAAFSEFRLVYFPLSSHPGADAACALLAWAEDRAPARLLDFVRFAYLDLPVPVVQDKGPEGLRRARAEVAGAFLARFPEVKALGASGEAVARALTDSPYAQAVSADMAKAASLGIKGTPVIFIGDTRVDGYNKPRFDELLTVGLAPQPAPQAAQQASITDQGRERLNARLSASQAQRPGAPAQAGPVVQAQSAPEGVGGLKVRVVHTPGGAQKAGEVKEMLAGHGVSVELFPFSPNGSEKSFKGRLFYAQGQDANARRVAELVHPLEPMQLWPSPSNLAGGIDISLWVVR